MDAQITCEELLRQLDGPPVSTLKVGPMPEDITIGLKQKIIKLAGTSDDREYKVFAVMRSESICESSHADRT